MIHRFKSFGEDTKINESEEPINEASAPQVKMATVATRNFDFMAVYDQAMTDEEIEYEFILASQRHVANRKADYDADFWKDVVTELKITEMPMGVWYNDEDGEIK